MILVNFVSFNERFNASWWNGQKVKSEWIAHSVELSVHKTQTGNRMYLQMQMLRGTYIKHTHRCTLLVGCQSEIPGLGHWVKVKVRVRLSFSSSLSFTQIPTLTVSLKLKVKCVTEVCESGKNRLNSYINVILKRRKGKKKVCFLVN